MIIKSMARKAPTFGQLIAYIGRDSKDSEAFAYNLYHSGQREMLVEAQFLENFKKLPARKNGNALYHEILSLKPQPHLSQEQIAERLRLIALYYCDYRAPQQLVWGKVHHDTDFPHVHLMISANEVYSAKRARLSKAEFAAVQRQTESYAREHFPELTTSPVYTEQVERQNTKTTRSEGELVRRTDRPSQKQMIADQVQACLDKATNVIEFKQLMKVQKLTLYQRGQTWGVQLIQSGRKYRLRTLGFEQSFRNLMQSQDQQRKAKKAKASDRRQQELEDIARQRLEAFEREQSEGHSR